MARAARGFGKGAGWVRFTDFTGKFVFHCHALHHEDHGMMSVVEVVDPENPDETTSASSEPGHDEEH